MFLQATYIWIDGAIPTAKLRSKMRVIPFHSKTIRLSDFPNWGFDGSSTYQSQSEHSDLVLKPVQFLKNPLSDEQGYLVLCEVMHLDQTPHPSNTRAPLRHIMSNGAAKQDPWIGFEQEYTLFQGAKPLGWPDRGYPAPQGPFYCGVGSDEVFGRLFVEEHTQACLDAGIMLFGINAEVMPGQWEFQIGYRSCDIETPDPLTVSDHLWMARWLLYRIGEKYDITATLHPKPIKGDWNGAGKHTNFSTKAMRNAHSGMHAIEQAIACLSRTHQDHITAYGHGLEERLTGDHETSHIAVFSSGIGNRSVSVRIPASVASLGYGYLEDRRPGANADPYVVSSKLLETICGIPLTTHH